MNARDDRHRHHRQLTPALPLIIVHFFSADRRKSSIGGETTLSRHSHKSSKSNKSAFGRKLESDFGKSGSADRRRLKSNDKNISSSSSCSDSDNETEIEVTLHKSRQHLENTEALKIRRHLLRNEDYVSSQWHFANHSRSNFVSASIFLCLRLHRARSQIRAATTCAAWRASRAARPAPFSRCVATTRSEVSANMSSAIATARAPCASSNSWSITCPTGPT